MPEAFNQAIRIEIGDLDPTLRELAERVRNEGPPPADADAAIRSAMNEVLAKDDWAMSAMVYVIVNDGVVHLWGVVDSKDQQNALRVAAENIPGVTGVEEHLTFSLPT